MNVQSLKRWHWVIVGLLVGAALGYARLLTAGEAMIGGPGFVSREAFERELQAPPLYGRARITHVTVERAPVAGVDYVRMRRLVRGDGPNGWTYAPATLAAPKPYPLTSADGATTGAVPSVNEYLHLLQARGTRVSFRSAWWTGPGPVVSFWSLGGAVVVGGIWPSVLRLLVGAGFGKPVEDPEYDLDRFKGEPPAGAQASNEMTAEDEAKLAELEQLMLQQLRAAAAAGADGQTTPGRQQPAPARTLVASPVEPVTAPLSDEEKEYAGQYYPVARAVHHEGDHGHGHGHDRAHGPPHAAPSTPARPPRGFTLVEVLVVIGVIGVLVSLLMPALRKARASAERVKCASNLRQLGMSLQMYANANGGSIPNWSGWHTYPDGQSSEDAAGLGWTEILQPYFVGPDDPAYNCPSFPGDAPRRNYFLAAQWAGRSGRRAMKFTDVTMGSRFVLSGDMTQTGLYPPPFGNNRNENDDCDRDDFSGDRSERVLAWPWDPGGFWMHRGGNNVLFDDLHVALFDRFDPSRMTFHPKQMQDWPDVTPGE